MSSLGRVAVLPGVSEPIEIREYPLPEVGPNDILVKISLATVCGSDVYFSRGGGPGLSINAPVGLGHEMTGRIYAAGKDVVSDSRGVPITEGDLISYSYFTNCGVCWSCVSNTASCLDRYRNWLGVPSDEHPYFHAAFGEYYYLRGDHWIFKVPDELSDDLVSPVNCAYSEVFYGLHKVGITLEDTVVIQGAGGLGLFAIAVAREMGAGQIIVIDKIPDRLNLALEMGADETLDVNVTSVDDRISRIKQLSSTEGADVVIEVTGSPNVIQEGIDILRPGGNYMLIGNINLGVESSIQPGSIIRNSKTISSVIVYEAWVIPRVLNFITRTKNKYPYHKIVSDTYSLEDINLAMNATANKSVIRAAIRP